MICHMVPRDNCNGQKGLLRVDLTQLVGIGDASSTVNIFASVAGILATA